MSGKPTVKTNNVPRPVIDACELTPDERTQFDYLDWEAIEDGRESAQFFRYRGDLHDLGEFQRFDKPFGWSGFPEKTHWDGYRADSFFSGLVVRYPREDFGRYGEDIDFEHVVVGLWLV